MSAHLASHAEVVKIAHLLQVEPSEVEYLAEAEADTLIELRGQIIEVFYGNESSNLKRFAKIGNRLPSGVIASLTREAVGPVLASRIAGFVDPKQAASVVSKLPVDFVVDIAIAIDPRRVGPVVGRLDQDFVEQLAIELVRRDEFVVLGQFASFADDAVLHAAFDFASDEALLHTAFVAEDKDRISVALAPQTDERIASIVKTALKNDLWPEAMDLFTQLSDEQYVRVVNIAGRLSPSVLDQMIKSTTIDDTWSILIPAIAEMDQPNKACEALLRAEPDDVRAFAETVMEDDAWDTIEILVGKLSDKNIRAFALKMIHLEDYEMLGKFIGFASEEILIDAFNELSDEALLKTAFQAADKEPISVAIATQDDKRLNSIIKTALKNDLWEDALGLFTELSDDQYLRVINAAGKLPPAQLDALVVQTTKHDCWQTMTPAVSQMENPNKACEALLRADTAHLKAFANTVIADKAWEDAEELIGKLSETNLNELIKRLTRLKLADGFVNLIPKIAA